MRERFRADVRARIVDAAHAQIAASGPTAISLRAIARDLTMAPSAVHRYFATRDDVLTALMVREFEALGDALAAAEMAVRDRQDYAGRAVAVFIAHRDWALACPHSWSLLYGSPVPGYVEPGEVCAAAARFFTLMTAISLEAGHEVVCGHGWAEPHDALVELPEGAPTTVPTWQLTTGLAAYSWMIGAITAEVRGFFVDFVADHTALYRAGVTHWVTALGFNPSP